MSKTTKRKYVTREVMEEYLEPTGDQEIVRVTSGRGNNLHEVETADSRKFLVSMPTKFRRNIWIKRGDYIIVEPIAEGNKVQAQIVYILYPRQIKFLKEDSKWPAEFDTGANGMSANGKEDCGQRYISKDSEDEDDDSDLFVNTNRPPPLASDTDSSVTGDSSDSDCK